MKKVLLILIIGLLMVSCKKNNVNKVESKAVINGSYIEEFKYEGCEYLWVRSGHGLGLTHKGNCKNH
jgi:hypothetical protein